MLQEKLHRPGERKRFEYSAPSRAPQTLHHPVSLSLSLAMPVTHTYACRYASASVIILAIRNAASLAPRGACHRASGVSLGTGGIGIAGPAGSSGQHPRGRERRVAAGPD
jgi:hypothetical protein